MRLLSLLAFILSISLSPLLGEINTTEEYNSIISDLEVIKQSEDEGNIWTKIYSNYLIYQELKQKQQKLSQENFHLRKTKTKSVDDADKFNSNKIELKTIEGKLDLLKEFQIDPFKKMIEPPTIETIPDIGNPIGILGAISYKKKIAEQQEKYEATLKSLSREVDQLKYKRNLLKQMYSLKPDVKSLPYRIKKIQNEIDTFKPILEIFKTTRDVYLKKLEETRLKIDTDIQQEYEKMLKISAIMGIFFLLFLSIKYLVRRYMSNKDSYYMVNKASNFTFLTILVLVLLFAYIENVSYMVTVIGFASAGIAIAMKDWFMSLMGWWVIVIGGSIHVGDRVKFVRGGVEYIGDIVDISPLRMTMQEDVTLTTYMHNRRSGRIIFIPNNYVFTDMIANYSHAGLKTVWDGIDFAITFDSNIDKALSIAKEVTKKYSKGYTDITRKQLNKLRSQYHIKNTNVEPRILSFIEPHGMMISAWYLTNAYATLTLRSKISAEIIQKIQERDDIKIAYPTQSLYVNNSIPRPITDNQLPEALIKDDNV
jgi:small-conductance mechanosensitive channel